LASRRRRAETSRRRRAETSRRRRAETSRRRRAETSLLLGRAETSRGRRAWIRLAAVGVVGLLAAAGCGSAQARTAHPAAVRTGPSTTGTTGSTPATYAWTRSAAAALDLGGGATSTLSAVLAPQAADEDWLIAGTRQDDAGATTATVWSSPDGIRWTSTALAGIDGRALAAAAWGTRTVIVGSVGRGTGERAAVWLSLGPGQPFALVAADAAMETSTSPATASPLSGSATMDVVGAGTQGVFAAGSVAGRQVVWYSTDGTDWVRLAAAGRLIDSAPGAQVTALLVTPGAVLAAGTVHDGTHLDGALWTSPDAINWARFASADNPFAGAGDHLIDGLAMTPSGSLLAVGAVRSGPSWVPASWISPNGAAWSQPSEALPTATRPQPDRGGTVVRAVATATTATTAVAVGGSSTAARVWTSTDGQNWSETPLPPAAAGDSDWSADLVATTGSTTVVADGAPGQPRVLVRRGNAWQEVSSATPVFGPVAPVATPAALVTDGDRLLLAVNVHRPGPAIGEATSSVEVLSSTDGTHWQRLSESGAMAGGWVDGMTVVSGSLVAVGSSTTASGGSAATVWTSTAGRQWTVAATFATTADTPAGPERATAVSSSGSTVVAVGTAPARGSDGGVDAPPAALAWSSAGSLWTPAGPLDAAPSVGAESPVAACSDGSTLVVVGDGTRQGVPRRTRARSVPGQATTTTVVPSGSPAGPYGQGSDGTVARAWVSTGAGSWTAGTVSPLSGAGGEATMDGCAAVGSGWIAWGQTPGPQGRAAPALWRSTDGVAWSLGRPSTLDVAGSSPLTDLATSGSTWVAVSGGSPAAVADPADPLSTVADPVVAPSTTPASSEPDGDAGVWASPDAGATWTRVRTLGAPWSEAEELSTDLVRIIGSHLVVVGQVDGRLAAWVAPLHP
jgi:hypothetical protein